MLLTAARLRYSVSHGNRAGIVDSFEMTLALDVLGRWCCCFCCVFLIQIAGAVVVVWF